MEKQGACPKRTSQTFNSEICKSGDICIIDSDCGDDKKCCNYCSDGGARCVKPESK